MHVEEVVGHAEDFVVVFLLGHLLLLPLAIQIVPNFRDYLLGALQLSLVLLLGISFFALDATIFLHDDIAFHLEDWIDAAAAGDGTLREFVRGVESCLRAVFEFVLLGIAALDEELLLVEGVRCR